MTKFDNIYNELRERFSNARGDKLPSRTELAKEFNAAPATVSNVLRKLKDEGYIHTVPGKGSFAVGARFGNNLQLGLVGSYLQSTDSYGLKQETVNHVVGGMIQGIKKASDGQCAISILDYQEGRCDLETMRALKLDGLIIAGGISGDEQQRILRSGFPAVLANYPAVMAPVLPFVDFDNTNAIRRAVKMLCESGRRRITFIPIGCFSVSGYERWIWEKYVVALAEYGVPYSENSYMDVADRALIPLLVDKLFSREELPPDGFVCWDQKVASEVVRCAKERGLSIPDDVSVVCTCDTSDDNSCSTFFQSSDELGAALFNALRERINDPYADVSTFIELPYRDHGTI